jgi:regulatory protein
MEYEITALKAQKRNRQRVNVYLDGEFAFGVSRIVAAWLEVGQRISDQKIAQLKSDDGREVTYQQALKYLSYRQRSEAEVRANLQGHDYPDEDINDVLDRLRHSGLVDDLRFAQAWVENRNELRPRGRRALVYELRQKGIADSIIDQTLETLDEEQLAYRAARKRATRWDQLELFDFQKKMNAYLSRRGFNYSVASQATDRVWEELQGVEKKP